MNKQSATQQLEHSRLKNVVSSVVNDTNDIVGKPVATAVTLSPPKDMKKTVKQVIAAMVEDRQNLVITLDYATSEPGIDPETWESEISSLQRAFMYHQHSKQITELDNKLNLELKTVVEKIDFNMLGDILEFVGFKEVLESGQVSRQDLDDFYHNVFVGDSFLSNLEKLINRLDDNLLIDTVVDLNEQKNNLKAQLEKLINIDEIDNRLLADAIIAQRGDIDRLKVTLEKEYNQSHFSSNLKRVALLAKIFAIEFLKHYKLWAHNLELNLREVLETEKIANFDQISDNSKKQLLDMLLQNKQQIELLASAISDVEFSTNGLKEVGQ